MEPLRQFGASVRVGKTFVGVWISLVAAALALAFAARGAGPLPGDLALARLIQHPGCDGLASSLIVHADDALWVLSPLVAMVALIGRRWMAALFVALAAVTGKLIPDSIKPLFARPRPSAELVRVLDSSEDYSFPSTTAFFAAVFFGMVAYLVWRERTGRLVAVAATGVSLVMAFGLSRVYAGEHWPTDVLGGWLLGGACLLVLVAAHRLAQAGGPTRRRRPERQ
jgi:membrane-associated phospholipid phosphatase